MTLQTPHVRQIMARIVAATALVTGTSAMPSSNDHPIRLDVSRTAGEVVVSLEGAAGSDGRLVYDLLITGRSTSHTVASFRPRSNSQTISKIRFPDIAPWEVRLAVYDEHHREICSEARFSDVR